MIMLILDMGYITFYLTPISDVFYLLTSFIMPSGKPPLEKEEIYKNGNFIISEYDFKVPNGESV